MSNKGVLLVNLGSPDSPSVGDVRKYLGEFLMDPRVLDVPWPIRYCIVHFAILPKRPRLSAEAYQKIWTPEGSPLVVSTKRVRDALAPRLTMPIEMAMRYQNPSIDHSVQRLIEQGVDDLLLIPLFPHYAMSSYETAVVEARRVLASRAPSMKLTVLPPYFNHPQYIEALVASATPHLASGFDHLLFSFHGLPERHLHKSDPTGCHCLKAENCCETPSIAHQTCYRAQCFKTVKAFVTKANIPQDRYSVAFQSRLGRTPWLTPYTDYELPRLAREKSGRMLVICPAFVSDCLETIEEIGMRGRDTFKQAGGRELTLIPCLNEHPLWLKALEQWILDFSKD